MHRCMARLARATSLRSFVRCFRNTVSSTMRPPVAKKYVMRCAPGAGRTAARTGCHRATGSAASGVPSRGRRAGRGGRRPWRSRQGQLDQPPLHLRLELKLHSTSRMISADGFHTAASPSSAAAPGGYGARRQPTSASPALWVMRFPLGHRADVDRTAGADRLAWDQTSRCRRPRVEVEHAELDGAPRARPRHQPACGNGTNEFGRRSRSRKDGRCPRPPGGRTLPPTA